MSINDSANTINNGFLHSYSYTHPTICFILWCYKRTPLNISALYHNLRTLLMAKILVYSSFVWALNISAFHLQENKQPQIYPFSTHEELTFSGQWMFKTLHEVTANEWVHFYNALYSLWSILNNRNRPMHSGQWHSWDFPLYMESVCRQDMYRNNRLCSIN